MNALRAGVKLLVACDDRLLSMGLRLAARVFGERFFAAQSVLFAA
jgi:hypothetical protein